MYLNNYRNQNMYPTYNPRQVDTSSNITMIQMRNSMLKSQYPKIYTDVNSVITELLPKYRNQTFTEDVVNKVVDEIYTSYLEKRTETRADDTIENNTNSSDIEDITKDLIKVVLLNRLIKTNLDSINTNQGMYQDVPRNYINSAYNSGIYDSNFFSTDINTNYEVPYMGYTPRNYF